MLRSSLLLLLLPALALAEPATIPLPEGPFGLTGTLDERYVALKDAEVTLEEWFAVAGQTVAVGMLRVELSEGVATPVTTATGITTGFVYRGGCTVSYRPPKGSEADSFQRGTGLAEWEAAPCDSVFLHTDDEELLDRMALHGEALEEAPTLTEEHKILLDDWVDASSVPVSGLARHLGATRSDTPTYDLMVFGGEYGAPPVVDEEDPRKPYNVIAAAHLPSGLLEEGEGFILQASRRFGAGKHSRLLASHPLDGPPPVAPAPPTLTVSATDLQLDLDIVPTDSFVRMDSTATLTLGPRGRSTQAILLSLAGGKRDKPNPSSERTPLLVSTVTDAQGRTLPFLHRRGKLLVQLAETMDDGQTSELTIAYAGSGVKKESRSHFGLFANWDWYPMGPAREHMGWTATICLPEGPSLAGTGVTKDVQVTDGRRCETHEAATAVNFPALNMGWWTGGTREAHGLTLRSWFDQDTAHQVEPALDLTSHILGVYADFFGPLPHKEIDIAQGRAFRPFWQAPDGLVELSSRWGSGKALATKTGPGDFIEDLDSYILAHELAHQYWGHVVGWSSYRDQWISESFADYAAYMYMLRTHGKASGHHQWWRRSSARTGRYGVMTLGTRNGGLYTSLVYSRGPLLLHMFRRMVGDEAFLAWMRTLIDVGRQKQTLTTEDLIVIAEHVTGPDARWFWEQWLHAPGVPNLTATWTARGPKVMVTLTQSKTKEPLRLVIPVLVQSKKGSKFDSLYQVAMETAELEVELPAPRGGVKDIDLDPDEEMVRDEVKVIQGG